MSKWKRVKSLPRRWQRNHLVNKYGAICYLCKKSILTAKDITFDHWVPLSKNGIDDLENYRLAHESCNHLKADLTPEEFMEFQNGRIQYK